MCNDWLQQNGRTMVRHKSLPHPSTTTTYHMPTASVIWESTLIQMFPRGRMFQWLCRHALNNTRADPQHTSVYAGRRCCHWTVQQRHVSRSAIVSYCHRNDRTSSVICLSVLNASARLLFSLQKYDRVRCLSSKSCSGWRLSSTSLQCWSPRSGTRAVSC